MGTLQGLFFFFLSINCYLNQFGNELIRIRFYMLSPVKFEPCKIDAKWVILDRGCRLIIHGHGFDAEKES